MPFPVGADGGTAVGAGVAAVAGTPGAVVVTLIVGRAAAEPVVVAAASSLVFGRITSGPVSPSPTPSPVASTTFPMARTCGTVRKPGPEGPKAVRVTTASAPAARPARPRTTPRDLLRLTRPTLPVRVAIVDPHRSAFGLPNRG